MVFVLRISLAVTAIVGEQRLIKGEQQVDRGDQSPFLHQARTRGVKRPGRWRGLRLLGDLHIVNVHPPFVNAKILLVIGRRLVS